MEQPRKCPQCGKEVPANAPAGLCPECLLKAGVATGTQGAARSRPRRRQFEAPTVAELAPLFPQLDILEFIGQGGMGAVYQARQTKLGRLVALKIIPAHAGDEAGFAARFAREARALAQLSHPNIVSIHDFGERGSFHFFVMEYVDGLNLRQLLNSGGIGPREALAVVPQICDALQYAHDRGIVHRDIKPENILMDKAGIVKIADFGLAKLVGGEPDDAAITGGGDVLGTPHYMAPEQVERPLEVDHRADIYSLGVVFYQMLTGELPIGRFAAPSKKVLIDVRLDEIVLRALEKEPGLRFQQAGALKSEVLTVGSPLRPPEAAPPLGKPVSTAGGGRARVWAARVLGGFGLAAAAILVARYRDPSRPRHDPAAPTDQIIQESASAVAPLPTTASSPQAGETGAPADASPPRPRVIAPPPAAAPQPTIIVRPPVEARPPDPVPTPLRAEAPRTATNAAPLEFDAMESDPQILVLQVAQAQREFARVSELYKLGMVTRTSLSTAENRVGLLAARLDGDRVAFAQIELTNAQKFFDEINIRQKAGLATTPDVGDAEMALEIAKIRLREAEARAAK